MFGEAGVNIANMAVSRTKEGGKALMALAIDSEPPPELVDRIRAEGFDDARFIVRLARGGGLGRGQFALMAAILVLGVLPPCWPESAARCVGILIMLAGVVGFVWAAPHARQVADAVPAAAARQATLVENGPYRFVRHPIYGAGLLFFLGVRAARRACRRPRRAARARRSSGGWKAGVEERAPRERASRRTRTTGRRVRRRML